MEFKKDKDLEKKDQTDINSLDNMGFLKNDASFVFLYKKTEKLVTALYMITNFLSDAEPLKWNIRELALSLLSLSTSLKERFTIHKEERDNALDKIKLSIMEIVSLLEISFFAGYISKMNFGILKQEFSLLLRDIDSKQKNNFAENKFLFPENLFTVDESIYRGEENTSAVSQFKDNDTPLHARISAIPGNHESSQFVIKDSSNRTESFKGHILRSNNISNILKDNKQVRMVSTVETKKNARKDTIIKLLRSKKELIIKDISQVIKDCSEKTIQRELLAMVHEGVLKKEGERRWTKYSLL